MQLLHGEGEAAVRAVNAEEHHGDVLRGAAGGPGALRGAVVGVALVERQRMVLPAGELLPLQNPAVKDLPGGMFAVEWILWGKYDRTQSVFLTSSHSQSFEL